MLNFAIPLEDELGDVLEKALRQTGVSEGELAERTGVSVAKIRDAIDYQSALSAEELGRIAGMLGLNEVGLCALGCGRYPQPPVRGLPFCVYPLRMVHGIGVVNAYLVAECGASRGVLFDTGPDIETLERAWPRTISTVDAVFVTHVEAEHVGGMCDVVRRFEVPAAYCPMGVSAPCGEPMGEGERREFSTFEVTAFSTPGHTSAHNCYLVRSVMAPAGGSLLISGDLLFAGSVGGAYYCHRQLTLHLRRVLATVGPETVIAPGHGPLTTAENELRYNPFVL